jgi:O-methyltransferase involved in polyketide biosynthesis
MALFRALETRRPRPTGLVADALTSAFSRGRDQLLILGAGYDNTPPPGSSRSDEP